MASRKPKAKPAKRRGRKKMMSQRVANKILSRSKLHVKLDDEPKPLPQSLIMKFLASSDKPTVLPAMPPNDSPHLKKLWVMEAFDRPRRRDVVQIAYGDIMRGDSIQIRAAHPITVHYSDLFNDHQPEPVSHGEAWVAPIKESCSEIWISTANPAHKYAEAFNRRPQTVARVPAGDLGEIIRKEQDKYRIPNSERTDFWYYLGKLFGLVKD